MLNNGKKVLSFHYHLCLFIYLSLRTAIWASSREHQSSEFYDQARHKPTCSAAEISQRLEISDIRTREIILWRQRTTKVLIRLRGCAGWSASFVRICLKQVFSWRGSYTLIHILGKSVQRLLIGRKRIYSTEVKKHKSSNIIYIKSQGLVAVLELISSYPTHSEIVLYLYFVEFLNHFPSLFKKK